MTQMSVYTAKEIMEIIPHRHPFMLIDTIEELEPGERALGRKCVSFNEPYFACLLYTSPSPRDCS